MAFLFDFFSSSLAKDICWILYSISLFLVSPVSSVVYTTSTGPLNIGSMSIAYRITPLQEVKDFATTFISNLSTACADENANNKDALLVVQASSKTLWVEQKEAFEALSTDAKTLFGTSNDATIVRAKTLYLHIVSRYGLATWTGAPAAASRTDYNGITNSASSANELIIAIIIAAGVSAFAVGGYFFIRRKHQ